MVAVTMLNKSILWNKPTYLGAAILDVSNLQFYKFHFEKIVPMYGDKARVMYKDTDSLLYEIENKDVYEDIKYLKNDMDFSSYPENQILFSDINKKVSLKMADELKKCIVTEAIFLKPKAYSTAYITDNSIKSKQSPKGVNIFVKMTLHHEKFKSALFEGKVFRQPMRNIVSEKHRLSINEVNKIVLSPCDTKRFYRDDGITSLAYGLYKTGQAKFCIESKNNEDVGKGGRFQRKKVVDAINNTWEQIEISGDVEYKRYDYSVE